MSFAYSPDTIAALQRSVSPGRLAPYLEASSGDLEAALRLYELNARLSSILYTPLQILEVTVRNALDDQFRAAFGDEWTDQKGITLQKQQKDDLHKAISEVSTDEKGDAVDYTRDMIIAELNFGFWVGVLGPKNEVEIWRKAGWKAFPHRPKGTERKAVQGALNSVRRLRNRIAHHCRIIHRDLADDHATILQIIGWVCAETRDWAAELSLFNPDDIPVPQVSLPFDGEAVVDPMPPATPVADLGPTKGGRARLSIAVK